MTPPNWLTLLLLWIVVCERSTDTLADVADKVYTRDLFGGDA